MIGSGLPVAIVDPVEQALGIMADGASDTITLNGGKSHYVDDADVATLFEQWPTASTITSMDLSINRITDVGLKTICDALTANPMNLSNLDIDSNLLTDDSCKAIGQLLATNSTLTRLDISSNNITDAGAVSIAEGLLKNRKLTTLLIRCASISSMGFTAIFNALQENLNSSITSLHLSGNQAYDDALAAISAYLVTNTNITDLNISNNQFTQEGLKCLADAIQGRNVSVLSLKAQGNGSLRNHDAIETFVRHNKFVHKENQTAVAKLRAIHKAEVRELKEEHRREVDALQRRIADLELQLQQK